MTLVCKVIGHKYVGTFWVDGTPIYKAIEFCWRCGTPRPDTVRSDETKDSK
jgi:hypothetical protein